MLPEKESAPPQAWRPNIVDAMQREEAQLRLDVTPSPPPSQSQPTSVSTPTTTPQQAPERTTPRQLQWQQTGTSPSEMPSAASPGSAPVCGVVPTSVPRQRLVRNPSPPRQQAGPLLFQPSVAQLPFGYRSGPLLPGLQLAPSPMSPRTGSPARAAVPGPLATGSPAIARTSGCPPFAAPPSIATAVRTALGSPAHPPVAARPYSPPPACRQSGVRYAVVPGLVEAPRYMSPAKAERRGDTEPEAAVPWQRRSPRPDARPIGYVQPSTSPSAVGFPVFMPAQPAAVVPVAPAVVVTAAAPPGAPLPVAPVKTQVPGTPHDHYRATVPPAWEHVASVPGGGSRSASPAPAARRNGDPLAQQLQALQQAKTQVAQQQAISNQQLASRREELRRETFQALCKSSPTGLSEALKRWPSPRPEDTSQALGTSVASGAATSSATMLGASVVAGSHQQDCDVSLGSAGVYQEPTVEVVTCPAPEAVSEAVSEAAMVSTASAPRVTSHDPPRQQQGAVPSDARTATPVPAVVETKVAEQVATPTPTQAASSQSSPQRLPSPRTSSPPQRSGARESRGRLSRAQSAPRNSAGGSGSANQGDGPSQSEIQAENARCRELIAWCASSLTPKHVRELRGLQKPPDAVRTIMEATATLLGVPNTAWPIVKKTLFSPSSAGAGLPEKLRGVNVDSVTLAQFRRVQKMLVLPEFDEESIQSNSKNALPLAVWCRAIGTCLARTRFHGRPESAALASANGNLDGAIGRLLADGQQPGLPGRNGDETAHSPQEVENGLLPYTTVAVPQPPPQPQERRLSQHQSPQETAIPPRRANVANAAPHLPKADAPNGPDGALTEADRQDGGSMEVNGLLIKPDISSMEPWELQQVQELEVSRPEVGSITFHGATDCSSLDIPAMVHLDVGEVLVYPAQGSKPPIGQGLNKRATVTMYQCWPPNGRGHLEDAKAQERYRWKIQQMTEEKRAKFIDYDCNTGVWKFQVEHF